MDREAEQTIQAPNAQKWDEGSQGNEWQGASVLKADPRKESRKRPIQCTAGGKRPMLSNFEHCPTPQSFVRCGPHHRAELKNVIDANDIKRLEEIWWEYRDDLTWPWYDKKPEFSDQDFLDFRQIANKVVTRMSEEYGEAMVLDQCTISNTNHMGHPPHADNIQFDSVWWKGKRIRSEDEVTAAREGAYVLWRSEKTSYRSYSCSVSLTDPDDYDGGEVQFFESWGDKDPIASSKPAKYCAVAFCGCNKNIHAVVGVRSGFRLQLLVWTRPPNAKVPESQAHVCYFRPGTGRGVWLTTADQQKHCARLGETDPNSRNAEEEDDGCLCDNCAQERQKLAWKDATVTPTTSAGTSPRTVSDPGDASSVEDVQMIVANRAGQHCPHVQGHHNCSQHTRFEANNILTKDDTDEIYWVWQKHNDDLTNPWYDKKPEYTMREFEVFRRVAQKVVDAMSSAFGEPLVLDQAIVSRTTNVGHPPHADNVQFDSVWWNGRQIKQRDELVAARGGAEVLWKAAKTSYRSYSATVSLCEPSDYTGGELEFYENWGERDPVKKYRLNTGNGVFFCGCQRSIHAVTGVKWGCRLVLLVYVRKPEAVVPEDQKHVCYFRPGTGCSIWLTTADLEYYPKRKPDKLSWRGGAWSKKCWWQQDMWDDW
jgi:predicted 2-oxoglutarate/Fe(II)-dependent dioxygenase YbiX